MWLYFPAKILSHSEGTWLCDCNLWNEIYHILRGPFNVITLSSQKSIPFWEDLTMWLCFPVKKLSHSEKTWQRDHNFQQKFYSLLRGSDYVIIFSSQNSIPFWVDLTMWLYFPVKNLSHSEGNWLCDYTFQPKTLSHSEGTWLSDHNFQQKFYSLLRGPDYVIIFSSQNSIPFWGELTLWLYFPAQILSHSEWTWLCDYTFQSKIYPILRGPDYVIILSSQKLSHSEVIWLCDHNFQPNIYPILRGPDYVIILSSQKSIPFRGNLTMWL